MGNCQAVDNATIAIQCPNGKVEKLYCPIPAGEIMRLNPGHYVALLLTTTLYSSAAVAPSAAGGGGGGANTPLRVTRIKLLRPSETLALGHVYRLVTSQEVMKGLLAKKMQKNGKKTMTEKQPLYFEGDDGMKTNQGTSQERHRPRILCTTTDPLNSSSARSRSGSGPNPGPGSGPGSGGCNKGGMRTWQPALKSISESLS
ncbi:uncharacterized protein LOC127241599 [Andrographis paniculata]|uniref:uncharacterized protein LOC127241599 n=1 Tax=Andrographis paniculata TaxID=175694 RepID=UPI0021E7A1A4|nr:uncharacterized protein LOC127241599 [Andrographis paniculata]